MYDAVNALLYSEEMINKLFSSIPFYSMFVALNRRNFAPGAKGRNGEVKQHVHFYCFNTLWLYPSHSGVETDVRTTSLEKIT